MEYLACISLPEFPLQLLLAKRPGWRKCPAAVVTRDKPQGEILWVSPEARAAGVLPGMRYAQGLRAAPGLRAAEVSAEAVRIEVEAIAAFLRCFSPDVEVSEEEPGVFWVNAAGLLGLFPSLDVWAEQIHTALTAGGRHVSVVVGFRRFAVRAVAKAHEGVLVLATSDKEEAALRRVPLEAMAIDPRLRDTLAKLDVRTLGEFIQLPFAAIRRRFGNEAARLHALAHGEAHDPFVPVFPVEPVATVITPETPEKNSIRLLFAIQEHLRGLLTALAERGEVLRELEVRFLLERQGERTDRIRPAEPTLNEVLILDLVRLRLEGIPLRASVREVGLTAHGIPASRHQVTLFSKAPRRDLAAANRALARIRAEWGDGVVVRARLTEEYLPEARFVWEPLSRLSKAHPDSEGKPALVRRLYSRSLSLGMRPRREPDGQLIRGLHDGRVVRSWGPYVLSGEWWRSPDGQTVHRSYYFLETKGGNMLWVYYDGPRRQWFLQGQVE